jgi:hypothetical protein
MKHLLASLVVVASTGLTCTAASAQYFEFYGGALLGGQVLNYWPFPPAAPNMQQMDTGAVLGAGYYFAIPKPLFSLGAMLC